MGMILGGYRVEDLSLQLRCKDGRVSSRSYHLTPCYNNGSLCKFSMLGLDTKVPTDKGGFPIAAATISGGAASSSESLNSSCPINVMYIDDAHIEKVKKLWILVVDDSTLCQKMIRRILESFGFDTDEADTGLAAVMKLKENPGRFGAVLMDLRMPIMNGITAIKVMREELGYTKLVIALTAESDRDILAEALRSGADDYISKPARVQDILNALKKHGLYGSEILRS